MTAKTRADLIEEIADLYGEYIKLTATGGSTTTIVDTASLYQPDSYWVGHYAYVLTDAGGEGAAPEGQERAVTAYDQGDGTITVSPAFSAAVGAGDVCELLPVQRATIARAINAAVRAAGKTWLVEVVDEDTITLDEDDYEYDLPADLVTLKRVLVREETSDPWMEVPANNWRVAGLPGAQTLIFDTWNGLSEDYTLRLEYLARPSEMTSDSGTLGLGEPAERELVQFVIAYALYWLHDRAANKRESQGNFQTHYTKADYYYKAAMAIRDRARGANGTRSIRCNRMPRARG
jgi:hypothetical protein